MIAETIANAEPVNEIDVPTRLQRCVSPPSRAQNPSETTAENASEGVIQDVYRVAFVLHGWVQQSPARRGRPVDDRPKPRPRTRKVSG
ncbi:hypothetical protein GCM10009765_03050 [Fodinicola feengrottensis]|uniref:Uncharacterized protein n=1 Tax=Fodinicola feengrottensis TaxID=435914 RepID=A0ABP4RPJ2_9ACTN